MAIEYDHFAIPVTTALNSDRIGSDWLSGTASDWLRQVTQNDFGRHCKYSYFQCEW